MLGGPVNGQELSFLEAPLFIGIGTTLIARYDRIPSDGEVLSYRDIAESLARALIVVL